jgi:hypothetical protein
VSDFTTFNLQYNTNTDASPNWTGAAINFGGSAGANELRWSNSANGTTGSANWPYYTRPASVQAVPQLWAYTTDTSGSQVTTYDGTNGKANVLRWNWDNLGTFAAAPQFSAFGDSTHTAPSPGTQPGSQSGSPIVNGHATDTGSHSYLKINAYGYGVDTGGVQQTPTAGSVGTAPSGSTGTAGSVSPGTGAWLTNWQDAQGWTDYIIDAVVPEALTAGFWYWTMILFTGPNMSTGTLQPVK